MRVHWIWPLDLWFYFCKQMHTCLIFCSRTYKLRGTRNISICLPSIAEQNHIILNLQCVYYGYLYTLHFEIHQALYISFWDTPATLLWFPNILKKILIILAVLAKERKNTFLAELKMPSHQDKKSLAPSNFSKVPTANYFLGGFFYSHNMLLMFWCLVGRPTCHP